MNRPGTRKPIDKTAHYCTFGLIVLAIVALFASQAHASNKGHGFSKKTLVGNWYLALDVGAFDPNLAGLVLPGLAQFHSDGTFALNDAGDFGAQSFLGTVATAQYGVWQWKRSHKKHGRGEIVGTTLFLEGDRQTGEVIGWNKVQFRIEIVDRNHLRATVNGFFLACDTFLPLPSPFSCPDPITNASAFTPNTPPNVPVSFTRIRAGQ